MERVLRNLYKGETAHIHCETQSQYGGLHGTLAALYRRKLVDEDDQLTGQGREVAAQLMTLQERRLRKD